MASLRGREGRTAVLQLLPLLLPFILLFVWGIGYTVAGSIEAGAWPLRHYRSALTDPLLRASVVHTLSVAFLSAILAVIIGTLMALALWRLPRPFLPAATLYKLPIILPHLTAAFIVMVLLSRTGILAALLYRLSAIFSGGSVTGAYVFPELLYGDSSIGLVTAYVWKEAPFAALMVLAVLGRLDYDLIHTGRMLGGGPVYLFRKIIYPHIAPALETTFIILFLYSLGAFDIPYLIGGSSPRMLSITVYNLYFRRDLAVRPQALALLSLLFLFSLIFVVLFFRVSSRMRKGRTG